MGVRAAVIGTGQIARRGHLPGYAQAGAEIVALCDRPGADIAPLAQAYGVARCYDDWRQMLADGGFEAVSICTPPALHTPMAVEALGRGIAVLVEKPMALTAADCDSMIRAADESGALLMVAHNQRYIPHHQQAKAVLESGRLGRPYLAHAVIGHAGPEHWSAEGAWYFQMDEAGPGALADLGSHKIDLLGWLLGQRVVEVAAMGDTFEKPTAAVDTAACLLRFDGGALATLHASWTFHPDWENTLVIRCERGVMRVPTAMDVPLHVVEDSASGPVESVFTAAEGDSSGWLATVAAFVEAVRQGQPAPISGADGRAVIATVQAAYEALTAHKVVRVAL